MKNFITVLSLFSIVIIDLVAISGTSFSQKAVRIKKPSVDSSVILADPKFQQFVADTAEWSKKMVQKVDSVRIEHSITRQRQEDDKELIKVQKKNFEGLYHIHSLASHGIEVLDNLLSEDVKKLPDIPFARPVVNPKPIPVGISLPDTLPLPDTKKNFWDKIQFWRR